MSLREKVLHWLRVPAAPSPPAGDHNLRVFRAARNYFWYRLVGFCLSTLLGAIGLYYAIRFTANWPSALPESFGIPGFTIRRTLVEGLWRLLELGAIAGFVVQAIGSLILLRLDFEQRWYLVSDRSLRIREGLVRLHERTMTFANVQEVSIRQGPLQRALRIADLRVRTAGGGSIDVDAEGAPGMHIAYFRGIANAEEVRDVIRDRLREFQDSGLGDPDEPKVARTTMTVLSAARELAWEARSLKAIVMGNDQKLFP